MCNLEKIFTPSFFDVMEHLVVHLPYEALLCGPVHNEWMYPYERQMSTTRKHNLNEGGFPRYFVVKEVLRRNSEEARLLVTRPS